jgi:hypothetical protein
MKLVGATREAELKGSRMQLTQLQHRVRAMDIRMQGLYDERLQLIARTNQPPKRHINVTHYPGLHPSDFSYHFIS